MFTRVWKCSTVLGDVSYPMTSSYQYIQSSRVRQNPNSEVCGMEFLMIRDEVNA